MKLIDGHWSLEQEINQLSNNNNPGLSDAELDRLINIAIEDFLNLFFYGKNLKNLVVDGFEANQRRLDMFENLVFGYPEEPKLVNPTNLGSDMYSFDLTKTKKDYREYVTSSLETNCGDFSVHIPQHNDGVETDYHRKSSKKFKIANGFLRNNKIYFKAKDFTPTALKLTYLKKPNKVSLGTYGDLEVLNNTGSAPNLPKVEWDINPDYHHVIVNIAAQNYMRIYNDQRFSLLLNKNNNE